MTRPRLSVGLRRRVRRRSDGQCEYCQLPITLQPVPPHVDHVIPRKHDGRTAFGNLALGCASCNLFKGSDVAGFDHPTGRLVPLFNPRTQVWARHFRWAGPVIAARTATGRVTLRLLKMNSQNQVRMRRALIAAGLV